MKITFIRPNMTEGRSSDAMQPLVFSILSGLTPPEFEKVLFDERLEPIPVNDPTDLVAITAETYTAKRAYQIADQFRARGIPVVMGGYHPTFLPEEALLHADAVVMGDAEDVWLQILQDAKTRNLKKIYRSNQYPSLHSLKFDREIFRDKSYVRLQPVQFGRGCRFACEFCSIHAFYGVNLRQRPVQDVIEEISSLNSNHIFFVDDNLFVDDKKAEEFFSALIPYKIRWSCQVSIDVAHNENLLKLMQKSGCIVALIGFESLNELNLTQMKKRWNLKYGRYEEAIRKFHDNGIMIYGTFVLGYDYDNKESFKECVDFALRSNFCLANFNPLTPMPGAELYNRLCREKRMIFDRWWLEPTYQYGQAAFHPRGMSADDLTQGCFRARADFNRYSSILKRGLESPLSYRSFDRLVFYWTSNLISRREIFRKQGMKLG